MSSSVSSLIKPLLGPSNGIWCFNKRSSAPSCFILSQKMFTQLWTYLLVNTVPAFSNKLSDKPFEGFWQTGPVYPISILFQTLSWHNFPGPGKLTQSCPSIIAVPDASGSKGSRPLVQGGMDVRPLHQRPACEDSRHDAPGLRGSCLKNSGVSFWKARDSLVTGERRRAGNSMYFPASVRAALAAGWSRDGRRQRGYICSPALRLLSHSSVRRKPVSVHTCGFPHPGTDSTAFRNDPRVCPAFQATAGFHTQPNSGEG